MWRFHNPVRISFGAGSFDTLPAAIDGRPYILVSYDEPVFRDLGDRLARAAGRPLAVIDDVKPNPDRADLQVQCARLAPLGTAPQLVVALGGGSVIDTAKVLAAGRGAFDPVWSVLKTGKGADGLVPLPIIAIPTTAGTGSEVTSWATVWDGTEQKKYSLAAPQLYPEHAVLDPLLTLTCPRGLTISTGLDALSHALESLWNRNANPISASYAVTAAREIIATLPELASNLRDAGLRERVLKGAMLAGMAFSNTKTAIAHSMSYPMTLEYGVVHGVACSFTLPMVLRSVTGLDLACDAALKQIFGADLRQGADRLEAFLTSLGVSTRAVDHGVGGEAWRRIIENAVGGERGLNFIGSKEALLAAA